MSEEIDMKKKVVIVVFLILIGVCLYIHRRVIKALLGMGEMPKAPSWHCWVSPEKRRA